MSSAAVLLAEGGHDLFHFSVCLREDGVTSSLICASCPDDVYHFPFHV